MNWFELTAFPILAQQAEPFSPELSEPAQQMSILGWMWNALGPIYLLGLPTLGFLAFIGACLVVVKNRQPSEIASFVYFAAAPLLLGLFGVVHGMIHAFSVIAMAGASPKPSEIAQGISTCLFALLVGMMCSFPAYGVLAIGFVIRSLTRKEIPLADRVSE